MQKPFYFHLKLLNVNEPINYHFNQSDTKHFQQYGKQNNFFPAMKKKIDMKFFKSNQKKNKKLELYLSIYERATHKIL